MCTGRNGPNTAVSFNIMRSFNSPFPLDELTDIDVFGVGGEAVGENHNNNNFRNNVPQFLTPPEQQGEDDSSLPWTPNDGDANKNFARALKQHTEELKSNQKATQVLAESVAKLNETIKALDHERMSRNSTVHRKSQNKKFKRYKDYVISFLTSTKNKKATRCTLRRNLNSKLNSGFLSHVLKDLTDNKHIAKDGNTYALVQN